MRSHVKNILAGVGTGAVVVLLAVLTIYTFASVSGSSTPVTLTIVKDVVPDSDPNTVPHSNIDFSFAVDIQGSNGFTQILDDDGADLPHPNTFTRTFDVFSSYSITEEVGNDIYHTKYECYDTDNPIFAERYRFVTDANGNFVFEYDSEGKKIGIKTESFYEEVPFSENIGREVIITPQEGKLKNVTCKFTNYLADASLTVKKIIEPSTSTDVVDFGIFTPNDNIHNNGYANFSLASGEEKTIKMAVVDGQGNPIKYTISELLGLRDSQNPEFTSKYQTTYVCVDANGVEKQRGNLSFTDPLTFNSGDHITCTFTNAKNPELVVRKVVDPTPQNNTEGFDFRITQQLGQFTRSADFNLSHNESKTFYPKFDWQQTVSELLSSGQLNKYWTSYSCKRWDAQGNLLGGPDESTYGYHKPSYTVNLVKGEKADCTFTNHLFEMTIKKVVLDEDGNEITNDTNSFEFKTNLGSNFSLDGNPNQMPESEKKFNFTLSGGIKFEELLTHDQSFLYDTSYVCTDRDGNQISTGNDGKINITSGLTNDSTGIICIVKNKQTPDAQVFVHKIFSPEDSDDIARVRVQPFGKPTQGEDKEIIHDHNQAWDVRPGDITIDEFQILQNSNNPLKAYTQSYTCDFLAPSTRGSITNNSSIIDIPGLKSGERVQCTLTNKEVDAVLKIKKNVVGSNRVDLTDDTGVFNFVSTLPAPDNAFKLDDNATLPDPSEKVFSLKPNTDYDFYEVNIPSGYTASFVCVDDNKPNDPPILTGADRIESLVLDKNQTVTCTFTNTKAIGTLIIKKDVVDANGDITNDTEVFKIDNQTDGNTFYLDDNDNQAPDSEKSIDVIAGKAYTFFEDLTTAQKSNYTTSYSCTDVNNTSGAGTTFTAPILGVNEAITCTFVNKKVSTQIIIKKDVKSGDGIDINNDPEVFNIENTTDNSDFYLDDNQNDPQYSSQMILNVTPGKNYSFFEDLSTQQEANYTQTWECKVGNIIIKSSTGASISNVQAQKGQTVICTITNTRKVFNQKIIVKKVTVPAGASEIFPIRFKDKAKNSSEILRLKDGQSTTRIVPSNSNYGLEEIISPGHPVNSYSCKYIPGNSTYKPFSGNGKIIPDFFLPKGHDIECTFKNCKNGLLCPLIGDPNDPNPTGGGTSVVGGGGTGGGGNQ